MKLWYYLGIIFIAFSLTIIFTYPFITKLPTHYNDGSDFAVNGFIFSYNYNSILSGRIFNQEEYFNGQQFYPQPFTLAYSDHRFIPSVIFSLPYFLTQNLSLSVNLSVFLSFVLSFISSFFCLNCLVKNKLASIIGAVVFTFNPISFIRFPVHLDLLSKYFLPPLFLYCYLFLKKPVFKNAFLFFLFFTLNALTVIYYQIFSILIIGIIFCGLFIYKIIQRQFIYIFKVLKLSLVIFIFLPLILYFDKPFLDFSSQEMVERFVNESVFLSARLIDWFMPSPGSLFYGNFVRSLDPIRNPKDPNGGFAHGEHTLGLNVLPMILFILSFFYFFTKKENEQVLLSVHPCSKLQGITAQNKKTNHNDQSFIEIIKNNKNTSFKKLIAELFFKLIKFPYLFFLIVLILSFFLTLGPYFTGWNNVDGKVKLPYYYFYDFLPLLKGIRVPSRAQFLFYVPFSLFVSFGALYLLQKMRKISLLVTVIIILILLVENYHGGQFPETSEILKQFSKQNYKNQLLFLAGNKTFHYPPFAVDFNNTSTFSKEIYYLTFASQTKEILVNGNSGYFPENQIRFLSQLKKSLDEDMLKKLISLNVNYLIIHKDLFDEKDLSNYEINKNLFIGGLIWNDKQIEIIDLKKINLNPKICDFEKDIDINFQPVSVKELNITVLAAVIKNKSGCFLPNLYKNKYKQIDFYINFIHHQAQIKLPIIIGPKEEIILSELTRDLKVNE